MDPRDVYRVYAPSPASGHFAQANGNAQRRELPLNIMLNILSFLDDPADIALVTRTSRLLYYMTLPRLYEHVTLRSYAQMRFKNRRPEGYGAGSPFSMGLNGLATRNYGTYVKHFSLQGASKERDIDEVRAGRIPDDEMMMNIAVRAAIERMDNLRSFTWEMSTKPLQTIYSGLVASPKLTSLTIRFPISRVPRPSVRVPALPTLRSLSLLDLDPLCYPDDFSVMLASAKDLLALTMHWNPRMREEGEISVQLITYFGKLVASNQKLNVKHLALHNLYARNNNEFNEVFNMEALQSFTTINSVNPADPVTVFVDNSWNHVPLKKPINLRFLRGNGRDRAYAHILSTFSGLEEIYYVNVTPPKSRSSSASSAATPVGYGSDSSGRNGATVSQSPSTSSSERSVQSPSIPPENPLVDLTLASDYFAAITVQHGPSLRRLNLYNHWVFSAPVIKRLVAGCPNLEEISLALENNDIRLLRPLCGAYVAYARAGTARKSKRGLTAVRMLVPPNDPLIDTVNRMSAETHVTALAIELAKPCYEGLKFVGLDNHAFELGKVETVALKRSQWEHIMEDMRQRVRWANGVTEREMEAVERAAEGSPDMDVDVDGLEEAGTVLPSTEVNDEIMIEALKAKARKVAESTQMDIDGDGDTDMGSGSHSPPQKDDPLATPRPRSPSDQRDSAAQPVPENVRRHSNGSTLPHDLDDQSTVRTKSERMSDVNGNTNGSDDDPIIERLRREVWSVTSDRVKDVRIFAMDSLDVGGRWENAKD